MDVEYGIHETRSPPDTSQLRVDNPNVIGPFGGISLQAEYAQIANND